MFGLLIKATQSSSRYTVTGLSYDIAAVVGGLMPLFATLVSQRGKKTNPLLYSPPFMSVHWKLTN